MGKIGGDPGEGPLPGLVAGARKPLPSRPLGTPPEGKGGKDRSMRGKTAPGGAGGKTAKDLGIGVVAHETDSFSSWESIHQVPGLAPQRLHVEEGRGLGSPRSTGTGSTRRSGREGMSREPA